MDLHTAICDMLHSKSCPCGVQYVVNTISVWIIHMNWGLDLSRFEDLGIVPV